jgi:hypothetical protein
MSRVFIPHICVFLVLVILQLQYNAEVRPEMAAAKVPSTEQTANMMRQAMAELDAKQKQAKTIVQVEKTPKTTRKANENKATPPPKPTRKANEKKLSGPERLVKYFGYNPFVGMLEGYDDCWEDDDYHAYVDACEKKKK